MSAATLGAGLTAVLSSFDARTSELRELLDFCSLDSDAAPSLERADAHLSALEGEVAALRGAILREAALLEEAAALRRRGMETALTVASMQRAVAATQPNLPGDALRADALDAQPSDGLRKPLSELGEAARGAPSQSSSATAPTATPRGRSVRTPPPLNLVTDAELATAPSFMRSRLDVQRVNAVVAEMQKLLAGKYALLSLAPAAARALPEADRKRLAAYKQLEAEGGKELFFFSEDDLRTLSTVKADATGKNLLAVLRHVGRLKEIKHCGVRCWRLC
jgi:hypothetical protein